MVIGKEHYTKQTSYETSGTTPQRVKYNKQQQSKHQIKKCYFLLIFITYVVAPKCFDSRIL